MISTSNFLFSMDGIEEIPEPSGHLSQSCFSGQFAEMQVAVKALKNGYSVFFPFGHSHKADLVVFKPPQRPITIQVKKATYQKAGDAFKFMVGSGKPSCAANPKNYGLRHTPYKKGDFDVLCAFIEELDKVVFYSLEDLCGATSKQWRPGNGYPSENWELLNTVK